MSLLTDRSLSHLVDYDIHNKKWVIKNKASLKQKVRLINLIINTENIIKNKFSSRYQEVQVIIE